MKIILSLAVMTALVALEQGASCRAAETDGVALAEAGWPVQKFHGGANPRYSSGEYANQIAEVWTEGTSAIRRREWLLPNDEDLKGQLISRKTARNSKGLMTLESKEEMRKRGISSPDRADAVLGAMAPCPAVKSYAVMGGDADMSWEFLESLERGQGHLNAPEGAHFG